MGLVYFERKSFFSLSGLKRVSKVKSVSVGVMLATTTFLGLGFLGDGAYAGASTLSSTASISGVVSEVSPVMGLAGICVTAYGSAGSVTVPTEAQGVYDITGLAPGTYTIVYNTSCQGDTSYLGTTIPNITVQAGQNLTLNVSLIFNGELAGNIAGGTAGNGLDGVCVIAISDASGQTFIARTGLNGNYGVPNIGPGVYTIEILPVCSGSMAYAPVVVSNVILQSDQVTTLSEVLSPTAS
ncbi:MAG: carboxypeptidase-like regulatory domain-containing protein [Firmicutes bacterium]|jgi:hypothetical protein|nr:carboxypeptidase-like regulatory domain-containing protein [Bacillota bacterium]